VTRVHAPLLEALARKEGDQWVVTSPAPGWFIPSPWGTVVTRGHEIGELEILGRRIRIIAPDVNGMIANPVELHVPRVVAYGDALVVLATAAALHRIEDELVHAPDALGDGGASAALVFRAPTSGRFYGRPSPDKPAFVSAGDELVPGTTICLLEVMKTFHRVTYGGAGLPERAKVREILVADGADVTSGEPLLALE
jgi:acetyl-CoA carboxylase biotin carboxyl carrier protein